LYIVFDPSVKRASRSFSKALEKREKLSVKQISEQRRKERTKNGVDCKGAFLSCLALLHVHEPAEIVRAEALTEKHPKLGEAMRV
jgi:hypothetical protein